MGQALYRKYRSKSLAELVGQEHITQTLANAIKEGRISHAYLFTGPRGVGKTSVARILAHEINQLPYVSEQIHLDIIEIDAASNNGVEDVRDLRNKVRLAPSSQKYKVYIIDEVHMLSGAAFNALLKTLEEPPDHVVFILATTEAHKLPATVISRTQRFHFRPVATLQVAQHLQKIAEEENIEIDTEAAKLIAEYGEGSFRDSISLLDQLRNMSPITPQIVETTLGIAPKDTVEKLIILLGQGDIPALITQYEAILETGITAQGLSQQLTGALRRHATYQPAFYSLIEALIEVPRAYNPKLKLEMLLAQFALQQAPTPPQAANEQKTPPQQSRLSKRSKVDSNNKVVESTTSQETNTEVAKKAQKSEGETQTSATSPSNTHIPELHEDQWQQIVAATKESGPTLHTVIRQAMPHFDTEKQLLTLTFRFPLHQKRLEEQKHRKAFSKILQQHLGELPEIQIILNKQAVKHVKPANKSADSTNTENPVNSVIDVMGGGEMVNI